MSKQYHTFDLQAADSEHVIDTMVQLLFETGHSDTSEVILFLMVSVQRKLPGAERAVREMLKLVFAEKSELQAVTDAYTRLYLTTATGANIYDTANQVHTNGKLCL